MVGEKRWAQMILNTISSDWETALSLCDFYDFSHRQSVQDIGLLWYSSDSFKIESTAMIHVKRPNKKVISKVSTSAKHWQIDGFWYYQ